VWGIDLGQCGLKAIRLQEIDGKLTATAFDYVEHPKILSQPDADPEQLTREALEKFLSRNTLRGDIVAISVPGQSGLARFVKLPPVEEKKIVDIVRFEAKQQIPFNLEEVVWDYQKIGQGMVTDGFAMDTEIGLFAMKRDMVSKYLGHFKDVGVEVHVIQMAPLALCNFASYDLLGKGARPTVPAEGEEAAVEKKNCVVVLDIGTDSSNLVITDGERVIWQRPIPLGGNHFTRALTKDLKLTFAKAEHLKRNATKSPDLKKILTALKPVLNDFVSEVQRSLGYFTNTHRDSQIDYLVGLGNAFRLPGLQRFLEEKLGLSVRKLAKLERLSGDSVLTAQVYTENILTFAVAYGLALQGLKQTRLLTNLLPAEIRMERLIRAKKPWAVATAASLMLGLAGVTLGYGLDYRTWGHQSIKDAAKHVADVKKKAAEADRKFKEARSNAEAEEERVKSIVAGQAEHINWLELTRFVNDCVPRPDGTNLPPNRKEDYWTAQPDKGRGGVMTGEQAYKEYENRLRGLKMAPVKDNKDRPMGGVFNPMNPPRPDPKQPDTTEDPGLGIDDLVQVNVETVDARFSDNLGQFWSKVRERVKDEDKGNIRPREDAERPPDGAGWVIEIRGYTYHHKKSNFVLHTFVENLARFGRPESQKPAKPPEGKDGPPPKAAEAKPPNAKPGDPKPPSPPEPPKDKGPVVGKISHVVLYRTEIEGTTDSRSFKLIGSGSIDGLMGEGGGMRPGPNPPGPNPNVGSGGPNPANMPIPPGAQPRPGQGGSSRGNWHPLGSTGSQDHNQRPNVNPQGDKTSTEASPHTRTEFVILLIWKEPTPSDALRGQGR
jgi:type IV pilus assembly protein PilM